jgi:hypothetical protein
MGIGSLRWSNHHFLDVPIGLLFQLRPNTIVNSKDGVDFAMLFTLWSSLPASTQQVGKAGGLQILCCQGIEVTDYNFTLDALALKPSDFCNVRVNNF